MRVLEIGANRAPKAKYVPGYQDAEILFLDANPDLKPDIVADARHIPDEYKDTFDGLFASHVLEHIPYWETVDCLKHWASVVKPGGQIHIVVPSLEWAAEQILSEHPDRGLMGHLYGGLTTAWDCHVAGFTMRHLRACMEAANLAVTKARTGPYTILAMGEPRTAEQHYVCGVRRKEG